MNTYFLLFLQAIDAIKLFLLFNIVPEIKDKKIKIIDQKIFLKAFNNYYYHYFYFTFS